MYIDWWNRNGPATLGERFGLKAKGPTKEGMKDLELVNKVLQENNIKPEKPRFQYDPISEELQNVNAPGWAEKATKQMDDIKKKPLVVKRTETKSPELSGVDRYILAKKI
jgi:hypothetical protein